VPRVGAAGAAMAVGGVLLVSAGGLFLIARSMFTPDEDVEDAPALGEELIDDLCENIQERIQENKGAALLAAVVAGLLVGRKR